MLEHPSNAYFPIYLRLSENIKCLRLLHLENEYSSMVVTFYGIIID